MNPKREGGRTRPAACLISSPFHLLTMTTPLLFNGLLVFATLTTLLVTGLGFGMAAFLRLRHALSRLLVPVLLVAWGVPVFLGAPLWRALLHRPDSSVNLLTSPVFGFLAPLLVSAHCWRRCWGWRRGRQWGLD